MKAQYGGYIHDQNELALRCEYRSVFDKFRRRMGEQIRFIMVGTKRASTQAALTTKLNELTAAYGNDYEDFKLFLDDGSTESAHTLISSATFGGVKVGMGPNFLNHAPWGGRPEYANQRSYVIVLEAETRRGSGGGIVDLYAWQERILIRGTGAAKWRYSPQISGAPQVQTLQTETTFWYIQQGMSIGRTDYAAAPGPLYPGIEHAEMREIVYGTPTDMTAVANQNEMYATEWKYFMEATASAGFSAFTLPTVRPF